MVPSGMKPSALVTKASASLSPMWGMSGLLGGEGWPTEPPPAGLHPLYFPARGFRTPDSSWAAVVLGLWQNRVPARLR